MIKDSISKQEFWNKIQDILPTGTKKIKGGIVIDGQNMASMGRDLLPSKIDILRLVKLLTISDNERIDFSGRLQHFCSYNPESEPDNRFDGVLNLYRRSGFNVNIKEQSPVYEKGSAIVRKKGDYDVGIALAAARMLYESDIDFLILISGDRDFLDLVDFFSSHGKKVIIISSLHTCARDLRHRAHCFITFESIIELVKFDNTL